MLSRVVTLLCGALIAGGCSKPAPTDVSRSTSVGQQASAVAEAVPAEPDQPQTDGFLTANFDPKVDKLPENFRGHDPERLFTVLRMLKVKDKDEYETSEQYKKRVSEAFAEPLYESVHASKPLAFVSKIGNYGVTYNADRQEFKVKKWGTWNIRFGHGWPLVESTSRGPGYVGSNAFGVTKDVDSKTTKITAIFPRKGDMEYIVGTVKVPAETARASAGNLAIVVVGRLVPPYIESAVDRESPTVSSPTEETTYLDLIRVTFDEMWLVNLSTGEIFTKKLRFMKM